MLDNTNPKTPSKYASIFRNRNFMYLLMGKSTSDFGDAFFNVAVLWVVYNQSESALQTAFVQVVWHISDILLGPIAGVYVDLWNRKTILVVSHLLSFLTVGCLWFLFVNFEDVPVYVIYIIIVVLNGLTSFIRPARFSIIPTLVDKKLLATASGLLNAAHSIVSLVANAAAGFIIALFNSTTAILIDSITFLMAAVVFSRMQVPKHSVPAEKPSEKTGLKTNGFFQNLRSALLIWRTNEAIAALSFLVILTNASYFIGPLYPALVQQQLKGGAAVYGILQSVAIVGGITSGVLTGYFEKKVGLSNLLPLGFLIAGISVLGIAFSTSIILTSGFIFLNTFGMVLSSSGFSAIAQIVIPHDYLGRVSGIIASVGLIALPLTSIVGGFLADQYSVSFVFAAAGLWILALAFISGTNVLQNQLRQATVISE